MLHSTSTEALLACPPSSPWNLPSFIMESTLSSSYSRSDLPLVKVQLSPILTLSSLMIWYSELTALFLFLLEKAAMAYLPTAFSVTLRPLFPSQLAQYAQVFLLKPAPFCKLFAGLGSTNKSTISLLFSSIFPYTSISLVDLAGTVFSFLFYQATMDPWTFISPGE